jgi:3',5'-cyclic-AMP phosphodiesterase
MPIHLPAHTRRSFLRSLALGGGAMAVLSPESWSAAADAGAADQNFFALLSDTHIPERPDVTARGVNMTDNLQQVIKEIAALPIRPANLLVNGDCAYLKGLPSDYANFASCVAPLPELGIDLHVTMGNHDDRQPLYDALTSLKPAAPAVMSKHVSVVESEFANWFLLDSLFRVNLVTGELGTEQLEWLNKQLHKYTNKPAVIVSHHNPQFEPPTEGKPWGGIADTKQLFDVLEAHAQVKAFIFGHTHTWKIASQGKITTINLPPVAYVFSDGQPNGWVEARLSAAGMKLTLHTLDRQHAKSGEIVAVNWN